MNSTTPAFISSTHMIPARWTWRGSGFIKPKRRTVPQARLDQLYSWDLVAQAILDAYALRGECGAARRSLSIAPSISAGREPAVLPISGPQTQAPGGLRPRAGMRVGIGPFTTQTASHNRGLGRYIRSLVSALLARDHDNHYVLYCAEGLSSDQLPKAANAEIRLLRPEPAHGEATLVEALTRLIAANPDATDVFLLLDARESGSGYALPAKPSNGLKVAALIHDLLPLFCHRDSCTGPPGQERPQPDVESLSRLASYDALLVTSEANRESLVFLLKGSVDRVVTIGTAADDRFFVPDESGTISGCGSGTFPEAGNRWPVRPLRGFHGVPQHRSFAETDRGLRDAAGELARCTPVGPDL